MTDLAASPQGGTPTDAVAKADAFGHGKVLVARTVLARGARWLGASTSAGAMHLRTTAITAPVLSSPHGLNEDFDPATLADIDLSVSSIDLLTDDHRDSIPGRSGGASSTILSVRKRRPPGRGGADRTWERGSPTVEERAVPI